MSTWDTARGCRAQGIIGFPVFPSNVGFRLCSVRDEARKWLQRRGWRVAYRPYRKNLPSNYYSIERWDAKAAETSLSFGWLPIPECRRDYDAALVAAILMAKEAKRG